MNRKVWAVALVVAVIVVALYLKSNRTSEAQTVPGARAETTQPRPRFVDFGTTTCAPCKVMLGVMAELERKYPDAMEVEFVNVSEQRDAAQRFGVRIIPTQIFYAPDGQELFRNTGVMRTHEVVAKWAELGYPMDPGAKR